jgi:hypothetical protein
MTKDSQCRDCDDEIVSEKDSPTGSRGRAGPAAAQDSLIDSLRNLSALCLRVLPVCLSACSVLCSLLFPTANRDDDDLICFALMR